MLVGPALAQSLAEEFRQGRPLELCIMHLSKLVHDTLERLGNGTTCISHLTQELHEDPLLDARLGICSVAVV